ncbi:MAG TPA: hypothetical protein VIO61_16000 [Anaerolineaceae bacterium]
MADLAELAAQLNDFDSQRRSAALRILAEKAERKEIELPKEKNIVNMHCHTFYSFNAYGYSPSGIAWLAKQGGWRAAGIVDFDVVDGVEEFLDACDLLSLRGATAIETRVHVPEFADLEMTSPGEPGVTYHMGIGFTSNYVPEPGAALLRDMRARAIKRNRGMVEKINAYLAPVVIDYDQDVLPLTPSGNATERHILKAYLLAAERLFGGDALARFWAERLQSPLEKVSALLANPPEFQTLVRLKLMKKGGVGYVQPGPDSFPTVDEFHRFVTACKALPIATWVDGTSNGERQERRLLEYFVSKGIAAVNSIPDRVWNVADPEMRRLKTQNLYDLVEIMKDLDLMMYMGTEMNAFGQKKIDDFDVPELQPLRQVFLDGAHFVYGHTVLQRTLGLGYGSAWAEEFLPSRRKKNAFYTRIGERIPPGAAGLAVLKQVRLPVTPESLLARFA